mgnify:CR=1 FL=1
MAGQVITVNWGTQTFTQVLTAADIAANSVAVIVPTSVMQAETPATGDADTSRLMRVDVATGNVQPLLPTPTSVRVPAVACIRPCWRFRT